VHSKRKRGRPLDEDLGWALLEQHFPLVYRRLPRIQLVLKQNPGIALPVPAAPYFKGNPHAFQHPIQ
jgi:hypothetical protein